MRPHPATPTRPALRGAIGVDAAPHNGPILHSRACVDEVPPRVTPPMPQTDAELVDAIIRRDRCAIQAAFDRHGARLYCLASQLCGPAHGADIVVAVFAGLWARPERLSDPRVPLRVHLDQETERHLIACLRSRATASAHPMRELIGRRTDGALGLDPCGLRRFLGAPMADRLAALPNAEGDVIALAYFGGYTCHEVAAFLGRTQATVIHQITAGVEHLRRHSALSQRG